MSKTKILTTLKTYISPVLIGGVLLASLFKPLSNKFDLAERMDLVLILGVLLLPIVFFLMTSRRERALLENFLLLGFLIFSVLSLCFSTARTFGLSEILVSGCGVAIYLSLAYREISWKENFVKFIVGLGLLNALFGLYLYFVRPETRIAGFFYNPALAANFWPNAFALLMLIVWPLAFHLLLKRWNFLFACLFPTLVATLILSFSRAALLVFCLQLLIFFIYFFKRFSRKFAKKAIFLIFAVLFVFVMAHTGRALFYPVNSLKEKVVFSGTEKLTSVQERLDFWGGAMQLSSEKPILGWGPFSFRFTYPMIQQRWLAFSDHAHNWFLKTASERGMPALAFFLLFLILVFHTVRVRFPDLERNEKDFVFLVGLALTGIVLHNLVDFNLNFLTNFLLFWILLGFWRSSVVKNIVPRVIKPVLIPVSIAIFVLLTCLAEGYYIYFEKLGWQSWHRGEIESAEIYFGKFEKTWMPRYFYLKYAVELKNKQAYDLAEKEILKHLRLSPNDGLAWSRLGEIYRLKGEYSRAANAFERAIASDPQNNLGYYRWYFQTLFDLGGIEKIRAQEDAIVESLDEYLLLVKQNVHFTAQTGNPQEAVEIYRLLGRADPGRKAEFDGKIGEISAAIEEYKK